MQKKPVHYDAAMLGTSDPSPDPLGRGEFSAMRQHSASLSALIWGRLPAPSESKTTKYPPSCMGQKWGTKKTHKIDNLSIEARWPPCLIRFCWSILWKTTVPYPYLNMQLPLHPLDCVDSQWNQCGPWCQWWKAITHTSTSAHVTIGHK